MKNILRKKLEQGISITRTGQMLPHVIINVMKEKAACLLPGIFIWIWLYAMEAA